jgi:hypothetical protein
MENHMDFDTLRHELNKIEGDNQRHFVGQDITSQRITFAINILELLSRDSPLLGSPYHPEDALTDPDSETNARWLAQKLVFCLTRHFVTDDPSAEIRDLPNEVVKKILQQCRASPEEILSVLKKARERDARALLDVGSLARAIQG